MANLSNSDIIAIIALILSAFATFISLKFSYTQHKLNRLFIMKEEKENVDSLSADLGANFMRLGNSNYRLKIYNKGKTNAFQVRIVFPDGNDLISKRDVASKFPLRNSRKRTFGRVNGDDKFRIKK